MFVTRHYLNQRTAIEQTVPFDSSLGHLEMPSSLLIEPAHYKGYVYNPQTQSIFNCALDFTQPGLYQIFILMNEGPNGSLSNIYNRINASSALGLASAVATLHVFGTLDDDMPLPQQLAKLQNSPLSMLCGLSANVLISLAQASGYQARLAAILTSETPNGYSDGHTIAEVKVDGRWVAFDTSMNFVMCRPSNNMLSVADACEGVWAGTTEFYEIAPFQFDAQPTVAGQWNPWGWCLANALYDHVERAKAVQHLYRIPMLLGDGGRFHYYIPPGTESQLRYALSQNYVQMSKDAFMAKFYPEVKG
jgi:hypothetical protein